MHSGKLWISQTTVIRLGAARRLLLQLKIYGLTLGLGESSDHRSAQFKSVIIDVLFNTGSFGYVSFLLILVSVKVSLHLVCRRLYTHH